jgi:hypothetical protein
VKVYSPAALCANPIGTKPATVTSVPVSIGKAVWRIGVGGGVFLVFALLQMRDHHLDRDHRVVDEQAEGDDEGAQRDSLQVDA